MVNYQNTKIYKIESHIGPNIYIGSTTKKYLSQRMDEHRRGFKRWKEEKTNYTSSYKIFGEYGLENCRIILLETYPCNSNDEKISREAHYINTIECVNIVIPKRTNKEWHQDNKEYQKEYHLKYFEDNKEKLKEYHLKYFEDNKEKLKEYQKEYQKEYRNKNKNNLD